MANKEGPEVLQELEATHTRTLENKSLLKQVRDFFMERDGVLLNEQETRLQTEYREIQDMTQTFESQYNTLVGELQNTGNEETSPDFPNKKEILLNLSAEVIAKRERVLLLHAVIRVVDHRDLLEIFENLVMLFTQLQDIVAGVLEAFRGENNSTTIRLNMVQWSHIAGIILPFLTEAFINLHGNNIEQERRNRMNVLLERVRSLYPPDWWFNFLQSVGGGILQDIRQHQENIETYQRQLSQLTRDIGEMFGYN